VKSVWVNIMKLKSILFERKLKGKNVEHAIQLKKDEIAHYEKISKNYPAERMERYAKPYLARLNTELTDLEKTLGS